MVDQEKINKFLRENITLIFAIFYILLPFDFLPDITPVFGYGDDLVVLVLMLAIRFFQYKKKMEKRQSRPPIKDFFAKDDEVVDGEIVNERYKDGKKV